MLTVLFATRNRADILRQVLEAYRSLQPPSSGWKLVVVDNGSTDGTGHILNSFAETLPLQSLVESKPGKNVALNSGLQMVEGDLTVLSDDDAFPNADWLVQLRKSADTQPDCAMFGGTVVARWAKAPPPWVAWVNQAAVYTFTDPSLKEGPVDPKEIYGPNMAIRTSIFQSGVRFDTSIGPRGSSYAMGSETELVLRLGRNGHKAWHAERAVVEHYIREEQLEKNWVMQRAVRFGRGQYRLAHARADAEAGTQRSAPLRLRRKMLKQAALMAAGLVTFQEEMLFHARWRYNYFRGEAIEARILERERRDVPPAAVAAARRDL